MAAERRVAAPPRDLPLLPVLAASAALAIEVTTHLVDFAAWGLRVRLLDSGYEWSYSHLLATLAMATGAGVCAVGAATSRPHRRAWAVAAVLFGVLLVDNVTRLHEHVPHWPLVYGPLLAGLCAALVLVAMRTRAAGLVYAGVALLCASLAIHVVGPGVVRALGWGSASWGYQVKVALKEGLELAGWVLLVPALGGQTRCVARPPSRRRSGRASRRSHGRRWWASGG
jgi:hypothetical protein